MITETHATLASELWEARIHGRAIPKPDVALSLDSAYAVQREIVRLSGRQQVGWKVGSTSKVAQQKLGTTEPGAGALLDGLCFKTGETVAISPAHNVFVEGEFAFRVAKDMVFSGTPDHDEIANGIDAFIPGIEVVGSRLETGISNSGRELITADGGANVAFVGGSPVDAWSAQALPDQPVQLFLNDALAASGSGADALDHPLNVLQWLVSHLAEHDMCLKAGDVVTTGTCTGLVAVQPGDVVSVVFPGMGEVSARFSALIG